MPPAEPEFVVAWPTLWIVPDWIEAHCLVPDGRRKDAPFEMYRWQLWCTANHYRVKPEARPGQLATAFFYRRSQVMGPQKTGKGPWAATVISAEAAGPVTFAGWAGKDDGYACSDHGCRCGWEYAYQPGDPMGVPWPTPLIQLLATSEDQTDNTYRPLQAMIRNGPLGDIMRVGEEFIQLGTDGRIEVVTSSATARLGNPITFALQDETGLYTQVNKMINVAETMRRGLAGMGGRAMETTNPYDPAENSTAQRTAESLRPDLFRFHRSPPAHLSYGDRRERHRIHAFVYAGSDHVDLDGIEAEAAELMEKDRAQAERFFGNRIVPGSGAWMDRDKWDARRKPREVPDGAVVTMGFDGSDVDDWTGMRLSLRSGYQFTPTYGPGRRPCIWNPAEHGGQVPRLEVDAAMRELQERYDVRRAYCDPLYWETEIDGWAEEFGAKRVLRWYTSRIGRMHPAAERLRTDVAKAHSDFWHDGCETTSVHVGNARMSARPGGEPGKPKYVLIKASPAQKIDLTMCSILAHEARGDALAAGEMEERKRGTMIVYSRR